VLLKIVPPEELTQFSEGFEPMRSLLIATAICAAVVSLTGCTFTVSGPCNSFTHQARIKACGCNGEVACNACETAEASQEPVAEDATVDCDPCAKQRKVGLLHNIFARDTDACEETACEETACEEEACEEEACEDDSCSGKGIVIPRVGKNLLNKLGSLDLKKSKCGCETDACGCEETACEEEACEDEACEDDSCSGKGIVIPRVGKNLLNKLGSLDLKKSKCGCETDACGCEATEEVAKPAPIAPAIAGCGCKSGACDGGCRGSRAGLLSRLNTCKDGSCDGDCEATDGEGCDDGCSNGLLSRMNGISVSGGRLAGMMQGGVMQTAMAQQVPIVDAAGADCCGRFGCGRDGKRCMTCRAKLSRGNGMSLGNRMGNGMGMGMGMGNGMGMGMGMGMGNGAGLGLRSQMGCGNGTCGQCSGCLGKFRNGRPTAGQMPHTAPSPGMTGMAPQFVYPYYTTRGPRDFLMANPPTIGY
jgi:hypothetical protein